jgi:hypothetical protein
LLPLGQVVHLLEIDERERDARSGKVVRSVLGARAVHEDGARFEVDRTPRAARWGIDDGRHRHLFIADRRRRTRRESDVVRREQEPIITQ